MQSNLGLVPVALIIRNWSASIDSDRKLNANSINVELKSIDAGPHPHLQLHPLDIKIIEAAADDEPHLGHTFNCRLPVICVLMHTYYALFAKLRNNLHLI